MSTDPWESFDFDEFAKFIIESIEITNDEINKPAQFDKLDKKIKPSAGASQNCGTIQIN